jgi:acyl carrier protein
MSQERTETVIRCILKALAVEGKPAADLKANTALFDQGVIDSFGVIALMHELEVEFGVSLSTEDLVIQNFETPERIAAMMAVLSKKPA